MKITNCEIIQDLLPSYSDKISSISTNKLVEAHLQECEDCRNAFNNMNRDIESTNLNNQDSQIDYLKRYKKKRKILIILSIILTIVILTTIFIVNTFNKNILIDTALYVDVNKFNVEYLYIKENEGKNVTTGETFTYKTLEGYLYSEEYKKMYLTASHKEKTGGNKIYYNISAKELPKGVEFDGSGIEMRFVIDENVEKIYIRDKKNKSREIWNKDMKVQTEAEWKKWYIDNYVPKEIKDLYNMNYENIPVVTSIWKHVYNKLNLVDVDNTHIEML